MNILIIEPPAVSKFGNQRIFGGNGSNKSDFRKPPLDLMMISGYLRKEGFDNNLLDANAFRRTLEDIKNIIVKGQPDILFFSTSTCTIHKDLLLANLCKEVNPQILTVALGTHVMALPDETFASCESLDVIVYSREWEQAALNIVKNRQDLKKAKGIYFRKQDGVVKTPDQPMMQDLDQLGFPAHDKLERDLYGDPTSNRSRKTMVMGQKACVNNCSFCCQPAFFGAPSVRYRSVSHVLKELEWVQEMGFGEVMFNDATITSDPQWAKKLFSGMIERKIDLTWNCSTRADHVDVETLRLMKQAGCHSIALGLESVDPQVLKNIRKHVDPDQVIKAVSMIREGGMDSIVFCVVGFPGETVASIERTIAFLKKLDTTFITLGIAVPAPGTDFYDFVDRNGYLLTKDWSKYDPMQRPVFSYPELSDDQILHYANHGLRQFYLRPKYMLGRARAITSFAQARKYMHNFIGFLQRYVLGGRS